MLGAVRLASSAWALATPAVEDAELLLAVRPAAVLHIWEFNPQNLANTAWALATLEPQTSAALPHLVRRLVRRANSTHRPETEAGFRRVFWAEAEASGG